MNNSIFELQAEARKRVIRGVCLQIIKIIKTKPKAIDQIYKPLNISKETLKELVFEHYPDFFTIKRSQDSNMKPIDSIKATDKALDFYIENSQFVN